MKKSLLLPLVLLSVCVIADERIILGSFEGDFSAERHNIRGVEIQAISTLFGVGVSMFNFKDDGLYLGTGFKYLTGDRKICYIFCDSFEASASLFSGEIGRDVGQWTLFVGGSFRSSEVDSVNGRVNEESLGLNVGFWFDYDKFKIRGTLTNLNESDYRAVSFGRLFQRGNNLVFGVELGYILDSEIYQFSGSFQIGRSF